MFLTPMEKIQHRRGFLNASGATDARIKEIGYVFSLMAAVRQHGQQVKMGRLMECMAVLDMENVGGETVEEVLLSSGVALRDKMEIVHPHLRREHRELRRNMQVAQRHARALRKVVKSYVFRPGSVEDV